MRLAVNRQPIQWRVSDGYAALMFPIGSWAGLGCVTGRIRIPEETNKRARRAAPTSSLASAALQRELQAGQRCRYKALRSDLQRRPFFFRMAVVTRPDGPKLSRREGTWALLPALATMPGTEWLRFPLSRRWGDSDISWVETSRAPLMGLPKTSTWFLAPEEPIDRSTEEVMTKCKTRVHAYALEMASPAERALRYSAIAVTVIF